MATKMELSLDDIIKTTPGMKKRGGARGRGGRVSGGRGGGRTVMRGGGIRRGGGMTRAGGRFTGGGAGFRVGRVRVWQLIRLGVWF